MDNVKPVKRLSAFKESIPLLHSFHSEPVQRVTPAGKDSMFEGLPLFGSLLSAKNRRLEY